MQTILEHTKLIGRLENNKINIEFIKEFDINDLIQCCESLENNKLEEDLYLERPIIQKE